MRILYGLLLGSMKRVGPLFNTIVSNVCESIEQSCKQSTASNVRSKSEALALAARVHVMKWVEVSIDENKLKSLWETRNVQWQSFFAFFLNTRGKFVLCLNRRTREWGNGMLVRLGIWAKREREGIEWRYFPHLINRGILKPKNSCRILHNFISASRFN